MKDYQVAEIALLADEYHYLVEKGMGARAKTVKEYLESAVTNIGCYFCMTKDGFDLYDESGKRVV